MIRQLITFPLRATWRGAELLLDGAARGLSLARALTGHSGHETGSSGPQSDPAQAGPRWTSGPTSPNGSAQAAIPTQRIGEPGEAAEPTQGAEAAEPAQAAEPAADAAEPAEAAPPPVIAPQEPARRAEPEREPLHLDDELELVAESADPGAADGAGAELTIDEPWAGYRRLKADEIIDRLAVATDAELAVVELYESMHKRRRTVLSAVARQQHRPRNRSGKRREE